MNTSFNRKTILFLIAMFAVISISIAAYLFLKPWKIDGTWVSGPEDGFGLMPVKKEFSITFKQDSFEFQGNVRPVKRYEYDMENKLLVVHTERYKIKIRIIDENTIRFNEGSRGVGLRIYRRIN